MDVPAKTIAQSLTFPLVAAHRGGAGSFGPENIMWTYKKAVCVAGAPVLEIDIQTTKDGVLVLSHDDRRWFGTISDMKYEKLMQVDAAYEWTTDGGKTFPERGNGHTIPTLEEVFKEFGEAYPNLVFYLDFKACGVVQQTLKMVNQYNLGGRILMGAVGATANNEVLQYKPAGVPSTPSWEKVVKLLGLYAFGMADNYLENFEHQIVGFPMGHGAIKGIMTQQFVDLCHKYGKAVWVFGPELDDVNAQNAAWDLGIDAIFSDVPDLCIKNLNARQKTNP